MPTKSFCTECIFSIISPSWLLWKHSRLPRGKWKGIYIFGVNIFINGAELKTANLKVLSFCQVFKNNQWVNKTSNQEHNIKLENAILNQAKKLKLKSS